MLQLPGAPDLGELWRSRAVRKLLNIIDHLPGHGYYAAAVANDDEHIKMMVEAGLKPNPGVSHVGYSPEVARLDNATDAINRVGDLLIAVNSQKGRRTPPTKPQRRPASGFARIQHTARLDRHKALTARVLPNGPQPESAPRVAGGRRRDRRVLDGTAVVAAGSGNVFTGKARATRDDERSARWRDRAAEVGRVPESSEPVT